MRLFLLLFVLLLNTIFPEENINSDKVKTPEEDIEADKLKTIETFLSKMSTLVADMTMDIKSGNKKEQFNGKIWLDRNNKLLRINYGKSTMVARQGTLIVHQENESPQEFSTEDTPAGILLRPSINFKSEGITIKSLRQIEDLWQLFLMYDSPAGSIPITLYFKPKPVMLLTGWIIQNPNGSITSVYLNPEKTHMSVQIDSSIFTFD